MIATEYDELDRELGELDGGREGVRAAKSGLRILPMAVGVVSLLALGGIVWYAYSQGVREGSETAAPLLRPDNQAKIAPEDPGGREIAGLNIDVYDRVNGEDGTAASVERILPPPEEPKAPPQPPQQTAPSPQSPSQTPPTTEAPVAREPVPAPDVPDPKLAAPEAPPPTVQQETEQVAAAATAEPDTAEPEPPAAPEPAAEPAQTAAADPAPAAAGDAGNGWRIQIAALKSEDAARSEWTKQQKSHQALLGSLALQIQKATVNGTDYFRVRGGPLNDGDAAKALCAKMKAAGAACIPVAPGK